MNTPTSRLKSPRKRPRPQSIIRNPYAKNNRAKHTKQHERPRYSPPKAGNDRTTNRDLPNEANLTEQLELASEFGGITEGLRDLTLDETGDDLQEEAIRLAGEGRNIFLTGKAGTGKSWTIRQIVKQQSSNKKNLQLTAPTGIAAMNIGGRTIHSWGGFKLGQHYGDFDMMLGEKTREMIRKTDILLIDEISMVDGHLLDVLECMVAIIRCYDEAKERLQHFRDTNEKLYCIKNRTMSPYLLSMRWERGDYGLGDLEPWGGLQLIVVGDFFQLPPVPNDTSGSRGSSTHPNSSEILSQEGENDETDYDLEIGRQGSYAFESLAWQKSGLRTIELQEVHRQKQGGSGDGLIELLNAMREGSLDPIVHHEALVALQNPLPPNENGIVPTELHALNRDVETINTHNLDVLDGKLFEFASLDEVLLDHEYKHKLLKKHKLLEIGAMPYLFASVEAPPMPPALRQARDQLAVLEAKKEELKAMDDFEALIAMRSELTECKDKVKNLEQEEQEKSVITLESITQYLDERLKQVSRDSKLPPLDPKAVFEKFQTFQQKLQHDFGVLKEHACQRYFQKGCRVRKTIRLKEESQVMLLWNLDVERKLANGSRGVITEFVPLFSYYRLLQRELDKGRGKNEGRNGGEEFGKASETAEESHSDKSGAKGEETKTNVEEKKDHSMDPESAVHGPSSDPKDPKVEDEYTDASVDPTTLEELKSHIAWLSVENRLQEEQRRLDKASAAGMTVLPYVRFTGGRKRLILPVPFGKEFKGYGFASRWQIPLCLAWAISIHKSQGMTIDWLHVNLRGCFENGQAYVACSRGRSLESMEVKNFSMHEIKTSESVKEFYKSLSGSCKSYTSTWADSLASFDALRRLKKELVRKYKDKRCEWCGGPCNVQQVKKKNCNEGRFFVACSKNGQSGDSRKHYFEWIPVKSTLHPQKWHSEKSFLRVKD